MPKWHRHGGVLSRYTVGKVHRCCARRDQLVARLERRQGAYEQDGHAQLETGVQSMKCRSVSWPSAKRVVCTCVWAPCMMSTSVVTGENQGYQCGAAACHICSGYLLLPPITCIAAAVHQDCVAAASAAAAQRRCRDCTAQLHPCTFKLTWRNSPSSIPQAAGSASMASPSTDSSGAPGCRRSGGSGTYARR